MKPNFIIAGSSAAGTSFLSAGLMQHPDIYFPRKMRPEPHYFYKSWEYSKPISYYEEKYFSDVKNETAIGERSSSYMFGEKCAERFFKYAPELKFIFMLRNPIERAYANYRYTALQGLEDVSFMTALTEEKQRVANQKDMWSEIQPYNYTGRGMYYEQIMRFREYYAPENLLLLKSEDVSASPQKYFDTVFRFLGVDSDFEPKMPPAFTSLSVIDPLKQMQARDHFKEKFDLIIEAIRKNEDTDQFVEDPRDMEMLAMLQENLCDEKIPMGDEEKKYLENVYEQEFEKQAKLFPFDISDWRTC